MGSTWNSLEPDNVVLAEDNSMGECGLGSLRASYDIIVSPADAIEEVLKEMS